MRVEGLKEGSFPSETMQVLMGAAACRLVMLDHPQAACRDLLAVSRIGAGEIGPLDVAPAVHGGRAGPAGHRWCPPRAPSGRF